MVILLWLINHPFNECFSKPWRDLMLFWSKLFSVTNNCRSSHSKGVLKNSSSKNSVIFPGKYPLEVPVSLQLCHKAISSGSFPGKFIKFLEHLFTRINRTCLVLFLWAYWYFILLISFITVENCQTKCTWK